jgi:hypothetical protein
MHMRVASDPRTYSLGMESPEPSEPDPSSTRRRTIRIVVVAGFLASGVIALFLLGGATAPKNVPVHPIQDAVRATTTTTPTTTTTTTPPTTTTIKPQTTIGTTPPTTAPPPTTTTSPVPASVTGPATSEHFTSNGNFSGSTYLPGADGFNLADVSSNAQTQALPAGVKGLEWIGSCDGATAAFDSTIESFVGDPHVFGFYLMDEPDPSSCPAANLKAESDFIHATDPGTYTFIIELDLSSSDHPTYQGGYDPANSDIDLYGLDPYPCRSENPASAPCTDAWLGLAVGAAEQAGIPLADIVPVYQAFGGGTWVDDGGGSYQLPTAAQEAQILATWASLVPTPVFDYAYSWGSQNSDQPLSGSPALQQVIQAYNEG